MCSNVCVRCFCDYYMTILRSPILPGPQLILHVHAVSDSFNTTSRRARKPPIIFVHVTKRVSLLPRPNMIS